MPKKAKKEKKKPTLKKSKLRLPFFVIKNKWLILIIISIIIAFGCIRKNEILYTVKEKTLDIIHKEEEIQSTKYLESEKQYLARLKGKYSGYGRQLSLADTKKIIDKACIYIANIEGQTYWNSENAKDLLVATAVVESDLRARYSQYGGNALGIFQIEYITFKDLWHRSIPLRYPKLYMAMQRDFGKIDFEMLQNNDMLSAIFARLLYARAKTRIPYRNDVKAQATYYKTYYNTHLGKAKTDTFIKKKSLMHKLK